MFVTDKNCCIPYLAKLKTCLYDSIGPNTTVKIWPLELHTKLFIQSRKVIYVRCHFQFESQ